MMFFRFALMTLCLALIPCVASAQVRIIHGPNGPQVVPVQPQYVAPQQPQGPFHRIPDGWASNNTIDRFNPNTGGWDTSNSQFADSAFIDGREQGKVNRRWERRPVYGANGQITGYQEGYVWNNSITGQEHFDMTNYTPNNSGGVHKQNFSVQGKFNKGSNPVYRPGVPRL